MGVYIQALVSGLSVGGIYALLALSFSVTYTTTKTLNFSQGDFVAFGAFIGVTILLMLSGAPDFNRLGPDASSGFRYPVAALGAGLAVGFVGILMFIAAIRPFAGKPGMNWVMSTIGFGIILQSLGLVIWGPAPVTVPQPLGNDIIRIMGAGVRTQELLILFVAIVVMLAFDRVMRKTRLGKVMRAVAQNPEVASLMGINLTLVMAGAFAFSSALAGLGGLLVAPIASASLYVGLWIALKAFSGAIIGGLDNPRGCIAGGFLLGLVESSVALWQAQWREIVIFLLIIVVLSLWPNGIFNRSTVDRA